MYVPILEDAVIHHIGIVIPDEKFEDFVDNFWRIGLDLGNPLSKRVEEFKCDCLLYRQIEVVIPDEGSKLYGWLKESITPMHHIAFRVSDINKKAKYLRDDGVPILYKEAVEGVGNTMVNFIHPSFAGFLIELVEVIDENNIQAS